MLLNIFYLFGLVAIYDNIVFLFYISSRGYGVKEKKIVDDSIEILNEYKDAVLQDAIVNNTSFFSAMKASFNPLLSQPQFYIPLWAFIGLFTSNMHTFVLLFLMYFVCMPISRVLLPAKYGKYAIILTLSLELTLVLNMLICHFITHAKSII